MVPEEDVVPQQPAPKSAPAPDPKPDPAPEAALSEAWYLDDIDADVM